MTCTTQLKLRPSKHTPDRVFQQPVKPTSFARLGAAFFNRNKRRRSAARLSNLSGVRGLTRLCRDRCRRYAARHFFPLHPGLAPQGYQQSRRFATHWYAIRLFYPTTKLHSRLRHSLSRPRLRLIAAPPLGGMVIAAIPGRCLYPMGMQKQRLLPSGSVTANSRSPQV
jgi:hypothetical protein